MSIEKFTEQMAQATEGIKQHFREQQALQTVERNALDLVRELVNPDGFGYSVTEEVRRAAKRVLDGERA